MAKSELSQRGIYLKIAIQAARQAGDVLMKHLGKLSHIDQKSMPGDLVTEADRESEDGILALLKQHFPAHDILAEESGLHQNKQSNFCWIIDPLDGTTNYAHQFPMFNVSIALFEKDKPIVGVVYDPFHQELFHALRGGGAYLNDSLIYVSKISSLAKSLLATGFAYDRTQTKDNNYAEFCKLTDMTQGVRRAGAAALDLAYVAAGRLDGYWERGLKPWDMAAGMLLVEEAGGKISDYSLQPVRMDSGKILATNDFIHEALSRELVALQKS
jgi:myo-inositol-1(or 4)-monophosphatase